MKTAIELLNTKTGRKVLITTAFCSNTKFAYVRDFGQSLKSVAAGILEIVASPKSLPATMFGKKKGPFLKLKAAAGYEIIRMVGI